MKNVKRLAETTALGEREKTHDVSSYLDKAMEVRADQGQVRILEAIDSRKLSVHEIIVATGIPYSRVTNGLDSLKSDGIVDWVFGSGSGSPRLWFKVPANQRPN
jgi:hypothetical protein